jgi:DNA-binding CsgD family transcriptional regulator/tetratricopeptide (TPR) repeat protein
MASVVQPLSPFALQVRRVTGAVVGRTGELAAIQQELATAVAGRLTAVTLEGEPGIGKTRLLLSAAEVASAQGFTTVAVAADEEIRGPFLLARSILSSPQVGEVAAGTAAADPLAKSLNALSGHDDPTLATLPADQKLLRNFDLGAVALRALAAEGPLAILVDDLQWTDDDSLRFLRYVVRADSASPILLMATVRPEELALVTEAVNLIADMERLGVVRRLRINRFTQLETTEFLKHVLGGPVDRTTAATMHAQAEGVPFILEEGAHAYRETGMIQEIDGVWTLGRNAERLVPSAVRTLISRRSARLPEETKAALAEAAVLGRHFSLKDLGEVQRIVRESARAVAALEEELAPAVATGLLVQHPEGSAADYSFAHEDVREVASAALTPARRRAVHAAVVKLLLAGEAAPESLPLLAHHARAAGDAPVCVRFATQATRSALDAHAPEEVLRVVELALPVASTPQDRLGLLQARDEALEMLRRARDRLEGLAELSALADALGDAHLALDVQLRRAAALRLLEEEDQAADLARKVRERAESAGDERAELASCLELGQDLLRTPIGEAFTVSPHEADFDAAEEAYLRAAELAEKLGDEDALASALREIGVIEASRVRAWMVEQVQQGQMFAYMAQTAAGATLHEILVQTPVAPHAMRSQQHFQRALEIFERLGDRRGAMSSVIAMAYLSWGPDIHIGSDAARHIEEIRRLASSMQSMTKESERVQAEGQMLYGVHVFARAKVIPDLALERAKDLHRHARSVGDRWLEFLGAGGAAMAHLDVGEVEEAEWWLDQAAAAAAESPTPLRARRLEAWRGRAHAVKGDADGALRHLERAVALATEQGRPAGRCEALARLALEAARMGAESGDNALLDRAESAARDAKDLVALLPGHPSWGIEADAALAEVALARGSEEEAMEAARDALTGMLSAMHEDFLTDVVRVIAKVYVAAASEPEKELVRSQLGLMLAMTAMRTMDQEIRAKWFRGPIGRELTALAGSPDIGSRPSGDGPGLRVEGTDAALLRLLIQGRTNEEIAAELGVDEGALQRRLTEMLARIGASSRAEATAFAFRERVV